MSVDFAQAAADYLALRRRLGHKLAGAERILDRFVVYLDVVGAEAVTLEASLAFILDPDLDPASTNPSRRLQAVRGFARYLTAIDPATEVPPAGIVSYRAPRRAPYLFTDDEIGLLMAAAAGSARTAQRAVMLRTLIGLLAVTGMRVGEALRLHDGDIDRDDGVITIRASKFGKSRHVPVTADTVEALEACMEVRDETLPSSAWPNVFVSPGRAPRSPTATSASPSGERSTPRGSATPPRCYGPASMTCATASPSTRSSAGTGPVSMSQRCCPACRPTSVTANPATRIAT